VQAPQARNDGPAVTHLQTRKKNASAVHQNGGKIDGKIMHNIKGTLILQPVQRCSVLDIEEGEQAETTRLSETAACDIDR
jgi:hypothetical protein